MPIVLCLADTNDSGCRALAGQLAKPVSDALREQLRLILPTGRQTVVWTLLDLADWRKCDVGGGVLIRMQQFGEGAAWRQCGWRRSAQVAREALSRSAGPGSHGFVAPFSCPEPFPFYVARIDDRLLLRPTPKGVRLGQNFCEIRFWLFASGGK